MGSVLSPRAREGCVRRYRLAGAAAAEIIDILGAESTAANLKLWAFYCNHNNVDDIIEKAREYASLGRQGELKSPVRAFQRWLSTTFAAKGGAR